jgi:regulation of enolase protein 1 (concanavalin A-like superfamily)
MLVAASVLHELSDAQSLEMECRNAYAKSNTLCVCQSDKSTSALAAPSKKPRRLVTRSTDHVEMEAHEATVEFRKAYSRDVTFPVRQELKLGVAIVAPSNVLSSVVT